MAPPRASLADVLTVELPPGLVEETTAILRDFGRHGCEGFMLWVGEVSPGRARVRAHLVPPQTPIRSEDGVGYFLEPDTMFAVNRKLADAQLRMIAQVHSHPSEAYHSAADDRYALVTTEGGFSLVVPDFAFGPPALASWAVYRLRAAAWLRLDDHAVRTTFLVAG